MVPAGPVADDSVVGGSVGTAAGGSVVLLSVDGTFREVKHVLRKGKRIMLFT